MGLRHITLIPEVEGACGRRAFLAGASATLLGLSASASQAHNAAGEVNPPESPPPVALTFHDDSTGTLLDALKGHVTALQLMFTNCQATCPIQGALFAATAKKLSEAGSPAQLMSITIDPGQDTPAVLRGWLKRFGSPPRWRAARPSKGQLEALVTFLKSKVPGPDPHSAQVYFFSHKAQLVMRSVDFPPAAEVVRVLQQLARNRA